MFLKKGSSDGIIKIWKIPEEGIRENLEIAESEIEGKLKKKILKKSKQLCFPWKISLLLYNFSL